MSPAARPHANPPARGTTPAPPRGPIDAAPIVLVGRPQSLRGALPVTNDSTDDLFISGPLLHTTVAEQGPVRASGSTVVPAGSSARLPLSVALDPHLPAGEYSAHVEISGQLHKVVLRVVEEVDLDVTPSRVYISPAGSSPLTATVVITNRGNVAVRLPATASATAGGAGVLTVRLGKQPTTIDPGETRTVTLEVKPPKSLDTAMRYDVTVSLGPEDITVIVLPTAPETTTSPTAGKRRPQL